MGTAPRLQQIAAVRSSLSVAMAVLAECQHLLPTLFERVLIPEAVQRELQDGETPEPVRLFVATAPDWLGVRSAPEVPVTLEHLDSGEREAIALALAVGAEFVLLDDRKGRQAAKQQGLQVSGTLGGIGLAAERKLVTLEGALDRLQSTNFRVSPRLLNPFARVPSTTDFTRV